jgi:hypothetical protein
VICSLGEFSECSRNEFLGFPKLKDMVEANLAPSNFPSFNPPFETETDIRKIQHQATVQVCSDGIGINLFQDLRFSGKEIQNVREQIVLHPCPGCSNAAALGPEVTLNGVKTLYTW